MYVGCVTALLMYEDPCVTVTWPYISSCAYSTYRPGQLLICRPRPIKLRPTPPTPANSVYSVQLRTAASTVTGIHIEFSTRALLLGSLFDPLVRYFFFGNPFPLLRSSSCKPSNHRCLSEHRPCAADNISELRDLALHPIVPGSAKVR
jgi:hypothetical protein